MSLLAVVILAPLGATALIPLLRRAPGALALLAGTLSLVASLGLLQAAFTGVYATAVLPGLPNLPLRLVAEPLNALLSVTVATVALCVLIYAVGYMREDPQRPRFFATLSFFVAAMQTLVLAGDWVLLLTAWELIGLSSYLLIGFWYQRPGVPAAASRAFLYTRSADLGLYAAIFILIAATGSSEIAATLHTGGTAAGVASLLLLVAAMGKSAQTPLHDWLQRAMAGPTPVSALLHSATLVAAGAILLIRSAPLLPDQALLVIGLVGGITTVVTGLIAMGESDLKRLLAASTSSQYGLMLLAVGAGVPLVALLHLIAHAAIKSSLFLGAGVFQHSRDATSLHALRGAGRDRPRIFIGYALAALALAGMPPLSGFFSKDAIVAAALSSPHAWLFGSFALTGTLLTGAYMARTLRILWRGEARRQPLGGLAWMGAGLSALVGLAIILGLAFAPIEDLMGGVLPASTTALIAGLAAALAGLALGWWVGGSRLLGPVLGWAQQGFAIGGGMNAWVVRPVWRLAQLFDRLEQRLYGGVLAAGRLALALGRASRLSDERGIDASIHALVRGTVNLGARLRALQSGLIHRELALSALATGFILGALLLAGWLRLS